MVRLWRIARMGLWLGATVFGGVAAAYPKVRERCSALGNLTPEDVDGLYSLAVVLPGPSFLNLWGAVCARAGGWAGAVVGQLALLLPAVGLVLGLPLLRAIPWVAEHGQGALLGATYGTAGLLVVTGIEGLRKRGDREGLLITGLALAALVAGIHPVLVLGLLLAWGGLRVRRGLA
ncbi:MAG TPA: chromate transporter [Symbiobacteriaceae bacterium]|nr:chromate transporter [Symbiobacteriaceae bacterium]